MRSMAIQAAAVALAGGILLSSGEAAFARRNFAERHPILTGTAAAVAAKKTGTNRRRHGRRRNFAQRHPILTGTAVAGVAHHYGKKHR
jgi:hypothetical protein